MPVVHAAPNRAYGEIQEWLKKERGIPESRAAGEKPVPYPFMAVWKDSFEEDTALYNPAQYRHFANLVEQGFGYAMRRPKAVMAGVDVNIYLKNLTQRDYIEYQIQALFARRIAVIPVDYGDPRWYAHPNEDFVFAKVFGKQHLRFTMESLTDNSDLEDSGLAGRTIRLTFSGTLHGWIPFQPYAVPLVYTTEFVMLSEDGSEIIEEVIYDEEQN